MKRSDPLIKLEALTNRLRSFAMKKRDRTTKGIIHYLRDHHNEKITDSELKFGYDEFIEMMEKVFQYCGPTPKMIKCVWCRNWVTPPTVCPCGKIKDVYKKIGEIGGEIGR